MIYLKVYRVNLYRKTERKELKMKKAITVTALVLCVALTAVLSAFTFLARTTVSASDASSGYWTDEASKDSFTFNGTSYEVKEGGVYGRYITVSDVDYYLVYDQTTVEGLRNTSGTEYSFIVANDITLTSYVTGGSTYKVTVEGCGHTITFGDGCTTGLFNNFGGTVNDLVFEGSITATKKTGSVSCWVKGGSLNRLVNRADITSSTYAGGLFGDYNGSDISDTLTVNECENYGSVTGVGSVGGLAGNVMYNVEFTNCVNSGTTDGTASTTTAGGIVGCVNNSAHTSVFTGCTNNGNVTGSSQTGGMIGQLKSTSAMNMTKCTNNGVITPVGSQNGGGMVGHGNTTAEFTECVNNGSIVGAGSSQGGITGYWGSKFLTVKDCTNTAPISCVNGTAAGISGKTDAGADVSGCVNTGNISSEGKTENCAAGILGVVRNDKSYKVNGCINYATVTESNAQGYAGGIVGNFKSPTNLTVSGCKNYGDVILKNASASGSAAGGIVGTPTVYDLAQGTAKLTVSECVSAGDVICEGSGSEPNAVGGILGQTGYARETYIVDITLRNNAVAGDVIHSGTQETSYVGGLIGRANINSGSVCVIGNCYFSGSILNAGNSEAFGYVFNEGESSCFTISGCFLADNSELTAAAGADAGDTCRVSGLEVVSGYLAHALNSKGDNVWYQNLEGENRDAYPVPDSTHGTVYEVELKLGDITGIGMTYSNTNVSTDVRISTRYGAAVRISDGAEGSGIRFISDINAYDFMLLEQWCTENGATPITGTLIAPSMYLDGSKGNANSSGVFTHDALNRLSTDGYAGQTVYLDVKATVGAWYASDVGALTIAGSVINIKAANYSLPFSGMGYIGVERNGETVYVYAEYSSEAHSRTVRDIAQAALNDVVYRTGNEGEYSYYTYDGSDYTVCDKETGTYTNAIGTEGIYTVLSPYNDTARNILASFTA